MALRLGIRKIYYEAAELIQVKHCFKPLNRRFDEKWNSVLKAVGCYVPALKRLKNIRILAFTVIASGLYKNKLQLSALLNTKDSVENTKQNI